MDQFLSKMKNLSLPILAILLLLIGFSCKKNNTPNEASVDVFARSEIINGKVGYSTVHSVTSTSNPMTTVTVLTPGGATFNLRDQDGTGSAFLKDTSMAGLYPSLDPPAIGTYTYNVTFKNGEQKVYTNNLTNDFLLPPVIDSLYIKPNGIQLRLKWEPVAGAQAYQIRISSGQNVIMPWLQFNDPSGMYTERLISMFAYYLPGTLTFELRAVIYESADQMYVQAISYASKSIDL
jgi:hypothetical protein